MSPILPRIRARLQGSVDAAAERAPHGRIRQQRYAARAKFPEQLRQLAQRLRALDITARETHAANFRAHAQLSVTGSRANA
jgi:hypothetical protein